MAFVNGASSWPGLGCPLVASTVQWELVERNTAFFGKRQIIASLSIALASYREKSGEFQIFLSIVKFSVQLPLRAPLRA